jgi:hypothetical protein
LHFHFDAVLQPGQSSLAPVQIEQTEQPLTIGKARGTNRTLFQMAFQGALRGPIAFAGGQQIELRFHFLAGQGVHGFASPDCGARAFRSA